MNPDDALAVSRREMYEYMGFDYFNMKCSVVSVHKVLEDEEQGHYG